MWQLESEYKDNSQYIKVIYFSPNADSINEAFFGYVDKDNVKRIWDLE